MHELPCVTTLATCGIACNICATLLKPRRFSGSGHLNSLSHNSGMSDTTKPALLPAHTMCRQLSAQAPKKRKKKQPCIRRQKSRVVPALTCKHAAVKFSNLCESHSFCHLCFVHPLSSLDPGKVRQTVPRHPVADKRTPLIPLSPLHFPSFILVQCTARISICRLHTTFPRNTRETTNLQAE